ncbi:MAG: hypothetical protein ACKPKO_40805, partial [Candidatus Fonsibacter sp.]
AELRATCDIPLGNEIVSYGVSPVMGRDESEWSYEATFDGGVRAVNGRPVAGAGVVIWGAAQSDGTRPVLGRCRISIPRVASVLYAEAVGCGEALRWLAAHDVTVRLARVCGENLAVLRFCAHEGRLRDPVVHDVLDRALNAVYARGWRIEWTAIRRRFNVAADRLATEGIMHAVSLAESGRHDVVMNWY